MNSAKQVTEGACFSLAGLGMTLQKPADLHEPRESDNTYRLTELDRGHEKFKEIAVDFKNVGLKVIKIEQLENHLLWHKYVAERKWLKKRKPQDPAFEMNEKYLYHGTTAKKDFICAEGLDARLSKTGRRFGQGIYFSDNPLKCVKYTEKGGNESFIVLARVILGSSKVYRKGVTDRLLQREPEKSLPYKGWRFYDSVEGCPKDFKEFVIYRNDRSLIECIITCAKDTESITSIPRVNNFSTTTSASKLRSTTSTKSVLKPDYRCTNDDDSGSSSDEDKSESTDSDEDEVKKDKEGYSSDSSVEGDKNDQTQFATYSNRAAPRNPVISKEKRGEDVLADKKRDFMLKTGESRQHVIESYLCTTGLDVDKAVDLFLDKENKRQEKERAFAQQLKQAVNISEEEEEEEEEAGLDVNPVNGAEKLKQMGTTDREAVIDALIDNFLIVIGLEDNVDNRVLSRKILFTCDYNLDCSIIAYYESL